MFCFVSTTNRYCERSEAIKAYAYIKKNPDNQAKTNPPSAYGSIFGPLPVQLNFRAVSLIKRFLSRWLMRSRLSSLFILTIIFYYVTSNSGGSLQNAESNPVLTEVAAINPITGPSYPCPQPEDPLAQLICSNPNLSLLDLKFVQTYESLYQQVGEAGDPIIRREDLDFDLAVRKKCDIGLSQVSSPSSTPPPMPPSSSSGCVVSSYQQQIVFWKNMLQGAAAEEANRSTADQVALQSHLRELGFLAQNSEIDGIFGPGSRAAIVQWQMSVGRQPTGLLGDSDAQALLVSQTGRALANENSGNNQASSKSSNPVSATGSSHDGSPVVQKPEMVGTNALGKLTFSNTDGVKYANLHETTWVTKSYYDEMSDQTAESAVSIQQNETGASAQVTGECKNGLVTFSALISDDDGHPSVNLANETPASSPDPSVSPNVQAARSEVFGENGNLLSNYDSVQGNLRINSEPESQQSFLLPQYSNSILIAVLSAYGASGQIFGFGRELDLLTTWRILIEIDTDHGPIIIKIPYL